MNDNKYQLKIVIFLVALFAIVGISMLIVNANSSNGKKTPVAPTQISETMKPQIKEPSADQQKSINPDDKVITDEMEREKGIPQEDKDHINKLPYTKDLFDK